MKAAEQQSERGGESLSNIHREPGSHQPTLIPLFLFLARLVASELQQRKGLRKVDGICHDRKRDHRSLERLQSQLERVCNKMPCEERNDNMADIGALDE